MTDEKFLIVVQSDFTRDIQVSDFPEAGRHALNNWSDYEGEVVVGIYCAANKADAISEAARDIHVSDEILKAYELK